MTEDEMVGWCHQLNGPEVEQAPGGDEVQEAWHAAVHGVTELDMTENNNIPSSGVYGRRKDFFLFTIVSSTVLSPQEIINNHLLNEKK